MKKENFFCLSQQEYNDFMNAFYQAKSAVRIAGRDAHDQGETNEAIMDVAQVLSLSEQKFKIMEDYLGK